MSNTRARSTAAPQGSLSDTPVPTLSSWAVTTARDDEIWNAMTGAQQLAALQDHFASDDCTAPSTGTIADIVARARTARSGA
ncbi:MAG: hypothetical protein ING44_08430 [Telmatospirillum sp.]|nr:hypothetical protein [Telmatospirillum sp.]